MRSASEVTTIWRYTNVYIIIIIIIIIIISTKSNVASTKSNVASTLMLAWTGL